MSRALLMQNVFLDQTLLKILSEMWRSLLKKQYPSLVVGGGFFVYLLPEYPKNQLHPCFRLPIPTMKIGTRGHDDHHITSYFILC